jgi:beta-lactamase superfamily II metal-dependent hydrolase
MNKNPKKYWLIFVVLVLFICVFFLLSLELFKKEPKLTFAMLDIGQGDALFIESPTGKQILVDGGPPGEVMKELSKRMPLFDRTIDMIIITNPDADHIAGFLDVLKNYKVGSMLEPGTFNESKTYENLKNEIKKQNIQNGLAKAGMQIDIGGGAYLQVLFPDRDVSDWERNDGSIVMKLVYGNNSFMLTGDATVATEQIILDKYPLGLLDVDVLKVGHHGSYTSTRDTFVKALSPKYALISVGKGNTYGHPHIETLDTLNKLGVKILRTDLEGTILFECDKIEECKQK